MTMQSLNLLPELRKLPGPESDQRKSFRDMIADLRGMERGLIAVETASATSFAMWGIFDTINVDDTLAKAHEMAFGKYEGSLHDHWQEMLRGDEDASAGFISALKGKVAEFNAAEMLEQNGYTNVEIAVNPIQPEWDISAISAEGEEVLFQVKTGAEGYASDVMERMANTQDIEYLISTELYDKIAERSPELIDQMAEIGSDYELVEGIKDGLNTLSDNMDLDLPDSIGEIVPYAGAIMMGARLIYNVIKTEKEFSTADRTTKNKMQVVQALTVMSRFGISTGLSMVGGLGGGTIGSFIPGIGNLIGGIAGTVFGAGMGMYLNKHLQPHMLNLALSITGLTHADLFYYKNKPHIDRVALSFRQDANMLAAVPS